MGGLGLVLQSARGLETVKVVVVPGRGVGNDVIGLLDIRLPGKKMLLGGGGAVWYGVKNTL